MKDTLQGRSIDVDHFVAHGYLSRGRGSLLMAQTPMGRTERYLAGPIASGELQTFLTAIGAWATSFVALPDNFSEPGLRVVIDDIAQGRPGPLVMHSIAADPKGDALSDAYGFLFGSTRRPPPLSPALLLYCQPYLVTYKLDRTFTAGASLPVPKLHNLELKAGPKLTEVQEISIKAPNAWVKVIDENLFIDILSRAAITETCINNVIQQRYSVVSKAAIAQNYEISVKDKRGQEFSLSAAVGKDQVQMSGGGTSSAAIDEEIKKSSALPVVLGVAFFDTEFLTRNRAKLVAPVFDAQAVTSADAVASERGRQLWQTQTRATLGQPAVLSEIGGGQGSAQCGGGTDSVVDLRSSVGLSSQNVDSGAQSFEFITTGKISGGTSQNLEFNAGIPTCQTRSADVRASVLIDTRVRTLVRSEAAKTIDVSLDRIDRSTVTVTDWNGRELASKSDNTLGQTISVPLSGAGVYTVRVLGTRIVTASGPGTRPVDERGAFTVSVR